MPDTRFLKQEEVTSEKLAQAPAFPGFVTDAALGREPSSAGSIFQTGFHITGNPNAT